jgi:uncharacterized protein (DUF1697 family)
VQTYIALLRGINVGGKSSLPMKELAALLAALGQEDVRTYIQSGNVVFRSGEGDPARLARDIRAEIGKRRGFVPEVLVLTSDDLEDAIARNPFPEAESHPTTLHVGFLAAAPTSPDVEGLEKLRAESERFHLDGRIFYLHAPQGVGRSKLAARAERLLSVPMTVRNWRTVCKIREIADELT